MASEMVGVAVNVAVVKGGWTQRYGRWQRWRLQCMRSLTDLAVDLRAEPTCLASLDLELILDCVEFVHGLDFLLSRFACVDRPAYRFKKDAKAAGASRSFRCVLCRRWHPGHRLTPAGLARLEAAAGWPLPSPAENDHYV